MGGLGEISSSDSYRAVMREGIKNVWCESREQGQGQLVDTREARLKVNRSNNSVTTTAEELWEEC